MKTENNIILQGKKIRYQRIGDGEPVLLVHGFAEDSTVWKYQIGEMSKHVQLILADLPGSGHSPIVYPFPVGDTSSDEEGEWTMDFFAEILLAIIEQEAIASCIMIGHSMGGYITLAFAEKYPDRLKALGLFHSSAYADSAEKKLTRQRGIEFIRTHGTYEFLKESIPNLFSGEFRTKNAHIVNEMIEHYKDFSPEALIGYYKAMIRRPDRTAVLTSFVKPILFILGKHDTAVPFEQGLQQSHLPQLSYIHILENSAHMGMWEEKEKSNSALQAFLQQVNVP